MHALPFGASDDDLEIQSIFRGHHKGIVRTTLWDDYVRSDLFDASLYLHYGIQNGIFLSGGEDSIVNAWRIPAEEVQRNGRLFRKRSNSIGDMEVDNSVSNAQKL